MDVLTREQRRLNMSRIRGRDTKPEMMLRRALHSRGLRFRLHIRDLPGCPDIVFPRYRAVIFVHGCFWHGHDCPMFRLPATRRNFWAAKICRNQQRDRKAMKALINASWRVLSVWECAFKGPARRSLSDISANCCTFIKGNSQRAVLKGKWGRKSKMPRHKR
ncbi:MAG: very short patch repair endonuclease [Parvibaculaceae bacterium]